MSAGQNRQAKKGTTRKRESRPRRSRSRPPNFPRARRAHRRPPHENGSAFSPRASPISLGAAPHPPHDKRMIATARRWALVGAAARRFRHLPDRRLEQLFPASPHQQPCKKAPKSQSRRKEIPLATTLRQSRPYPEGQTFLSVVDGPAIPSRHLSCPGPGKALWQTQSLACAPNRFRHFLARRTQGPPPAKMQRSYMRPNSAASRPRRGCADSLYHPQFSPRKKQGVLKIEKTPKQPHLQCP